MRPVVHKPRHRKRASHQVVEPTHKHRCDQHRVEALVREVGRRVDFLFERQLDCERVRHHHIQQYLKRHHYFDVIRHRVDQQQSTVRSFDRYPQQIVEHNAHDQQRSHNCVCNQNSQSHIVVAGGAFGEVDLMFDNSQGNSEHAEK